MITDQLDMFRAAEKYDTLIEVKPGHRSLPAGTRFFAYQDQWGIWHTREKVCLHPLDVCRVED